MKNTFSELTPNQVAVKVPAKHVSRGGLAWVIH
jgi:hypothetical protein